LPGSFLHLFPVDDPENVRALYQVLLVLSVFIVLAILLSTFVAIKFDDGLPRWSWGAVLWPLWILKIPHVVTTLSFLFSPHETKANKEYSSEPQPRVTRAQLLVSFICVISTQMLLVTRLDGIVSASYLPCLTHSLSKIELIRAVLAESKHDTSQLLFCRYNMGLDFWSSASLSYLSQNG
jgi:hypothetical protein